MKNNLALISLKSFEKMSKKVDAQLLAWAKENGEEINKESFLLQTNCPRFGTGEAKGVIEESIRGKNVFILVDVCNYSLTYTVCGMTNHMSPDDHYQDLKRIIAACNGKANKIVVVMPFLYESRQHKRTQRESLDCAIMLQELEKMGVHDIITFDAHDPRVQNAIPFSSLENVSPSLQFVETLMNYVPDLELNPDKLIVISPDEGATHRAIYLANVLGVNMGMFYKRRDYTKVIDGRNPIISHEYLGDDVKEKDVIVIDDMISSGDSMLDVATQLKSRGAKRVLLLSTFGLFTNGMKKFDKAYEEGLFYRILTTNAIYQDPKLLNREYYLSVDMTSYIAALIDRLNDNQSISDLINPAQRIKQFLSEMK